MGNVHRFGYAIAFDPFLTVCGSLLGIVMGANTVDTFAAFRQKCLKLDPTTMALALYDATCDSYTTNGEPNACDADGNIDLVANAVYDTCTDDDVTGATCTPTCAVGYTATIQDNFGFTLMCDANGDFSSADSTLICGI
jgi:hypothetical protein